MTRSCDICSQPFEAVKVSARFCSAKCRMAAHRARQRGESPRPRREPVPTTPAALVAPPIDAPGELLAAVLAETALCGSTAAAQQAIHLARALESNPPPHTLAALHRALAAARAEVRASTPEPPGDLDIIDTLRLRRDLIKEAWAEYDRGALSRAECDAKVSGIRAALAVAARPDEQPGR